MGDRVGSHRSGLIRGISKNSKKQKIHRKYKNLKIKN
jgi:hypothetical protein